MSVQLQQSIIRLGSECIAVINVDTAADLSSVTTTYFQSAYGFTLACGSIANVVDDSTEYKMQSDGTWVLQEKSPFKDVYTKTETDTAISTAIGALDVSTIGGAGNYIREISQTDGVISATAATLANSVDSGNNRPITSDAIYNFMTSYTEQYITGKTITTTVDLDDYRTPGVWRTESGSNTANLYNKPDNTYGDVSGRGATIIVQYNGNTNYIRQEYHPGWNANQDDKFFVRHFRGPYSATDPRTGWSNWYVYEGVNTGS